MRSVDHLRATSKLAVAFISVLACYLYFEMIGPIQQYGATSIWSRPANINDHLFYFDYARYRPISDLVAADNNFGISWLFNLLTDPYDEFQIWSVNVLFMLVSYYFYVKICDDFRLPLAAYWAFLVNCFLLYFSLLINKDMATIAVTMAAGWLALNRRFLILLLLAPFVFVLRQQLALFLLLVIFLEFPVFRWGTRALIVLAAGSVAGVVALQTFSFIDQRTLGEGLTGQMSAYFLDQAWLAPLGVPIRLLLYIFDYLNSLAPMSLGYIDAIKALRIPSILFFFLALPSLFRRFSNPLRYTPFQEFRPVVSVVIAFLAALLINPQINARYLTCLVPLLVLLTLVSIKKVPYIAYLRKVSGIDATRAGTGMALRPMAGRWRALSTGS